MSKYQIKKSEAEWKAQLSEEEYKVLREKGTERAFMGEYNMHFDDGTYTCMACKNPLFNSSSKFDSGCGWPSFDESIEGSVEYIKDTSHGMIRTEILCTNCGSHLGHIFNDGPTQTGQRYCVNSVSINFDKK
ncbi:peptide-methionine (R)-S-oxide reductase MsrB [Aquimarina sp. AU474]|uniref:peptide-methionine (R)-S-oxide reductase MsrB n=1 Tax=Aquimarina sp. AU474 TaxID=2108529 RepID=UPI000D6952ED|nr:peptide-methionine (R)-S-oxide reductase MsrB [Aquimarina sp. AU474]